ncbi:MAG: hypothetical protein M1828_002778 [Chrysothrix sp. TS-e1954]|nr:MAG: hypothetical protein M1828_002778 [Chrysothrix sp. TS-e1954]
MSHSDSEDTHSSVFDEPNRGYQDDDQAYQIEDNTNPTQVTSRDPSGEEPPNSYDLKPPPLGVSLSNIELLSERLFSTDHLKYILRDSSSFARFKGFLDKYRPNGKQALQRYLEIQKAVSAVDYANAVANKLNHRRGAARLERDFDARARSQLEALADDCLPGYITHRLVQLVTETLVKEITGQNTPIMRDMVRGLAEVYCLSDPSLPDNPIVYASEEFFKCTQYGREYVIGRNCRFLQGPRTAETCVRRLIDALADGIEICETILNYRRDGSPFINLLMIAPLYDNKGTVRYFIGAQIDINGLVEGGHGLDSLQKLLKAERANQRYGGTAPASTESALQELSMMMDPDEADIVRNHGRERRASESSELGSKGGRRYLGMDGPDDINLWPSAHLGSSGRLPGVFQNYLLVRPYPSLRITFTSPALRIPGLLQSKFLDRISGPQHIRDGILSALSSGIGVTAKISWLPSGTARANVPAADHDTSSQRSAQSSRPGSSRHQPQHASEGKPRWIHCTPLMGSDEKVGVWMVVMVESESITGALNAHERAAEANAHVTRSIHEHQHNAGIGSPKYNSQRMYKEYLRREGRLDSMEHANGGPGHQGHHTPQPASHTYPPPSGGIGSVKSRMSERSRTEEKQARAKMLADRALAGEDQFRDF